MPGSYWIETLGCPKNQVDSDKLEGTLLADGLVRAGSAGEADVVVVNTCAFVEQARQESVDVILALADARRPGARLVVTGCLAERYGGELAAELPEVDQVAGFGVPLRHGLEVPSAPGAAGAVAVTIGLKPGSPPVPALDLLNLPRPRSATPWAYVKIAEGCDRTCGFCAIPSFRGPQRSRAPEAIVEEVAGLGVREVVLVAQDLASYGKDVAGMGAGSIVPLVRSVGELVDRVRLLYLYPSDLTDGLVEVIGASAVPYFDLSLQHVSRPLLRRMRRWGDGDRFLRRIGAIRAAHPDAVFRSNFIVGYPGETEEDHDELLAFVRDAQLDWCGFFTWSREEGTYAAGLDGVVDARLAVERHAELSELQDRITAAKRAAEIGAVHEVLVDAPGEGRSHREAPEIDGVVRLPGSIPVGSIISARIIGAEGPDLDAVPVDGPGPR